jgi:N-acetylglucosaminyl-diphospho-decaprenol L-rhamnosyltransferase
MDLSIIIVSYNNKNILRECLRCVKKANIGLSYEIIVLDNASGDGTVKMLRFEFPEVITIASSRNTGFAAGNNLAVRQAKGNKILFLNPDIVVLPGSVEKMAAYLDAHQEAGLVGPKLLNPDGTLQYSAFRFPKFFTPLFRRTPLGLLPFGKKRLREYLMMDWNHNETKEVDWLLGSALMMRKSDYGRLAKFDERFFLYFDDCDLARQVWISGKKVVYLPHAQMIHFHRRESAHFGFIKGLFHKPTREHIKSWIKYFWKYR